VGSRIALVVEGLLLVAALGFLAVGALGLRPRMDSAAAARRLEEVRSSGKALQIAEVAAELARLRPRDASVKLVQARALLAAGKSAKARAAYAEAAKIAKTPRLRAAAEIGRGSALLLKSIPPARADIEAAKKAFERARRSAPRVPDAHACLAVAHAWAGDMAAAEAAAKAAKGKLELEPAIALACCKAFIAASKNDNAAALAEFSRARALDPQMRTELGKYLERRMKVFVLDSGARADAPKKLRKEFVDYLKKAGKPGIKNPKTYPMFLRAAVACTDLQEERGLGMDLLAAAIAARPDDPVPLLFRAVAVAKSLDPVWNKAAEFAGAHGVGPTTGPARAADLLPGGSGRQGAIKRKANPHLKNIERKGAVRAKDVAKAAELHAARGGKDAERALGLFDYMFRWHVREAELSSSPPLRRKRRLSAVAVAAAADRSLGKSMPNKTLAALVRGAGVLLARERSWAEANARFMRSLELFPEQPELKAFLAKMRGGLAVVATYPSSPERARLSRPMAGAEFSLPGWLGGLSDHKVTASVGVKGGARTAITPVASGTGLWYVPGEGEFPEGAIEVRFEVAVPFAGKTQATSSFPVDGSPPEIVSRSPEADAVITTKQPYIRIGWKDASGLDPASVEVVLEPVTAVFPRQVLVTKGRQKSGKYVGSVTWKRTAPVVPPEATTAGVIVTAPSGTCPAGTFRIKVRMKDAFGRAKQDAWTFRIR